MASYQLGYLDKIWDPILDDGTLKGMTSFRLKTFPFSDAGLGTFAYTLEILMGFKGDITR
ncbi:hypothetical protein [Parachlamydia sp. AcF125]|uniref:hypothetical protein n=1 Tax=Parachlamydia sp. AcF125 TaxID=2795736 RepID=UPI001BD8D498|nr:hypothetical protein [Parachlamydia sp. AcF125]MBS4167482.1 hypothetical protein [Parachlamydia sp. AcF125]